ncbi:acyl-CoA synthetase [Mycobacterium sp. SMC-4]|uniref:acyl-CoA synthetase n=1 Tax=Mycobacterium sp. SMC-4 TaxID=2857059 RepID=UPI0021B3CA46|nr:acyl-CoA synthetase [Mycobacterium sp. SMC-4]UXA19626.1 acyl-CoA synthetase [Mycobacterium sp. SMC-4]
MSEWTIGGVVDAIAAAVPDRVMTICADRRSTYAQTAERTRRLANFLVANGIGIYRERSELQGWECGQDRVALIMHNDLYPDMVIGALKARAVPVNVNFNYTPREVQDLLGYLKPRAVICHRSLGAKFADVLPGDGVELVISIDDHGVGAQLAGAISLDEALVAGDVDQEITASPDDVMMICTGGTTGRPKGVMWRQTDTYVISMNGADHESASEIHAKVAHAGPPWFAVSPLMHAAGMWTAFAALLNGQTVILYDKTTLDPAAVLSTAEKEKVGLMTMVGDAYAGPLIAELRRHPYDLSSLFAIGTGGAATNQRHQDALLELLPQIMLINGYGSSETGNMAFGRSQSGDRKDTFERRDGVVLLSEDRTRFVVPGEPEVGWVAREGRIPLGYFDDAEATAATFPKVDGRRVVISGDRGSLEADGTLRLLGRDSLVVNTGGEKVFVEEVEEVVRSHPDVADALVVGRPSERWGEQLVALVAVRAGAELTDEALRTLCREHLARYKAPKQFLFVDQVRRLGNGKADYRWAKEQATQINTPVGQQ